MSQVLKLMIVDDSNLIRKKITRSSDESMFEVVATAENGKQALDYFEQYKPDVVTMDLTMPEMNGIDCIEKIVGINPGTRILVVSALTDEATGIEALEKGAIGFLPKPFTEEQLLEALCITVEDDDA